MNRWLKLGAVIAVLAVVCANEAAAQPAGPLVPAITPEQIKASEALAATYDQSAAREKVRLETFKNRPLASVIQKAFDVNANYLMMAARMMPEAAYGFRPTPELRTFGEQINHATAAQYSFCNQAGVPPGVERRPPPSLRQVTAKADIVKALDDSVAYCDSVLKAASEAWLMEIAPTTRWRDERADRGHPRARVHVQQRPRRGRLWDADRLPAPPGSGAAVFCPASCGAPEIGHCMSRIITALLIAAVIELSAAGLTFTAPEAGRP